LKKRWVWYDWPITDLTKILEAAAHGDSQAAEQLLPLVYEELRGLAARKMAHEKPGQTIQPTALVHEAWLRLAGPGQRQEWRDRHHFLAAAAEAMRRILIDKARRKAALKRGANEWVRDLSEPEIELGAPPDEILAVHDALDALAAVEPVAAEVVKLRYFVGLGITEIAESLGLSTRTTDRHWAFARAWLKGAIKKRLAE
jgi:RNA polymerase sigma factor (TIGR02999 family)